MKKINLELEYFDKHNFKADDFDTFLVIDMDKTIHIAVFIDGELIDEGHFLFGETKIIENIAYIKKIDFSDKINIIPSVDKNQTQIID